MAITIVGTPVTPPSGFLASDVFYLVRLWLSDPDSGDAEKNPDGAAPRFDTESLVEQLNRAIDDLNVDRPDLGLRDPTDYTIQGHITGEGDTLSYPAYCLEAIAHKVAALALSSDNTDESNLAESDRHLAFYSARLNPK